MLKIKSLNAASYISTITNIEASVGIESGQSNHFEFPKTIDVMKAYDDYRKATSQQGELIVNLIKFNYYIRAYKGKTKEAKTSAY